MSRSWAIPSGLVLGSMYLGYESLSITSSFTQSATVGPAFFPRIALAGMIVIGLLQLGYALFTREAATQPPADHQVSAPKFYWWDLIATVGLGCLYVALMRVIGFIPATLLFQSALLFVVFRQRGAKVVVGVPLVLTAIYFVVFVRLLEMPLPQGYGIFRAFSQIAYY